MWPQFPCISSMVVVVGAMLQFYLPVDHSVFLVLPLGCPRVGNLLNSTHTHTVADIFLCEQQQYILKSLLA